MHAMQFLMVVVFMAVTLAVNQPLAQSQKGGQSFPFVHDIVVASSITNDLIVTVFAQRFDIPTSGFAEVNINDLLTGEFSSCVSTDFDLTINNARTNLFFMTEGGFQCEVGEPILVECRVTDDTIVRNSVFNELVRSSTFGQQKQQGRTDFYNGLACNLEAFGVEGVFEGFAFSSRIVGTPVHP